jgi:hypothetical protein
MMGGNAGYMRSVVDSEHENDAVDEYGTFLFLFAHLTLPSPSPLRYEATLVIENSTVKEDSTRSGIVPGVDVWLRGYRFDVACIAWTIFGC